MTFHEFAMALKQDMDWNEARSIFKEFFNCPDYHYKNQIITMFKNTDNHQGTMDMKGDSTIACAECQTIVITKMLTKEQIEFLNGKRKNDKKTRRRPTHSRRNNTSRTKE